MRQSDIADRLALIEEHLEAIEPLLLRIESALPIPSALSLVASRLLAIDKRLEDRVPVADIRLAIEDVFQTYGLVAQLKEVYESQRDQLVILVGLAAQLLADAKKDDQELRDLLVQLRELGRKHVRGLSDLERAQDWHEREAERRDAGTKAED